MRVARALLDSARLDVPNRLNDNGERLVQQVVLRHARPAIVIDVGAHHGEWSMSLLAAAENVGSCEVNLHAFEPCASSFETLSRTLSSAAIEVHLSAEGLSNRPGPAVLYKPHEGAGSSSLHGLAGTVVGMTRETVQVTTLDDYCTSSDIDTIDLLKVDAEGHDLLVIEGSRRLLEAARVGVVQFEYNFRWIGARRFLKDAFDFLQPLGYHLGKVTPRGIERYEKWHPELETYREGNYLAMQPSWLDRFPSIPWWNDHVFRTATEGFSVGERR